MKCRFKVGDKVIWKVDGAPVERGIVTLVVGSHFEVTWNDGEVYSYEERAERLAIQKVA